MRANGITAEAAPDEYGLVPEQVEGGFLAFLLSRIIGVMKEDFWYRLPKSTVLRPSPIHWWEDAPELVALATA